MIVHAPELRTRDGRIRVEARIEVATAAARRFVPERLWYEFPEEWEPQITRRCDGFAAAVLLLTSSLAEDLETRTPLSPRLIYGMEEYARVFQCWFPGRFHPIRVQQAPAAVSSDTAVRETAPDAVATAFSGGVDSMFTLFSHLAGRERHAPYRITHGLFVHGFDVPLSDAYTFGTAAAAYDDLFRKQDLRLVTARTNARDFAPGIDWELAHGAALISTALVLGGLHRRFFVPASTTYEDTGRWGSDPLLDHLLSTDTLDVVHDGAFATRMDKIAALSGWAPSHAALRVCWEKPAGLRNCCRCYNCIVTMCGLEAAGVLGRYETFPLPLRVEDVRAVEIPSVWRYEVDAIVMRLRELGKSELATALRTAVALDAGKKSGASASATRPGALRRTLAAMRGIFGAAPAL